MIAAFPWGGDFLTPPRIFASARIKLFAMDYKTIEKAFSSLENNFSRWQTAKRYYDGKFDKDELNKLKQLKRSRIFIPTIRNTVNILISFFNNAFFGGGDCPIALVASDDAPLDEKTRIDLINKLVTAKYNANSPRMEILRAFSNALIYNFCVLSSTYDKHTGKIVTRNINLRDFAIDRKAANLEDVGYCCYRFKLSADSFKKKIESGYYKTSEPLSTNSDVQISQIFYKTKDGWGIKTYVNAGFFLREGFTKRLPFQFGYIVHSPDDVKDEEDTDAAEFGGRLYNAGLIENLIPIQNEINLKRNQKNDLVEERITPSIIVPDTAQIDPNELKQGAGKRIKCKGQTAGIMFFPTPNAIDLNYDLEVLGGDFEQASGVNSLLLGQTGAADRRSFNTISAISANANMRIADMLANIKDTVFNHWARNFVYLVLKHTSPDEVLRITGIENLNLLDDFARLNIRVDFGQMLDKEKMILDLKDTLQVLAQNPNISPTILENILRRIVLLRFGAGALKEFFGDEDSGL